MGIVGESPKLTLNHMHNLIFLPRGTARSPKLLRLLGIMYSGASEQDRPLSETRPLTSKP